MVVHFLRNNDGKTTTFLANHQIINDEVPYVPEKLVDHRGLALYLFCIDGTEEIGWDELQFDDTIEHLSELERSFFYMFNPVYVKEEIVRREEAKRARKRY